MMVSALIERELAESLPIRNGVFVAVVGPSGAGKDTVIGYAKARFAGETRLEFVRRVITRPSDAASEDHDTLADAAFAEAEADGAFSLCWDAHGLRYGLRARVSIAREPRGGGGDWAVIRIDDDGPGIAPGEIERMMEPFARGDPSRCSETGGAGLGLTLARAIAEQHEGTLTLANRSGDSGPGLTATLRLPIP